MLYNRIITNIEHFIKKIQEKIEQCYAVEIMTNIEQKLKIKSGSNKSWIIQWRVNFVEQLNSDNENKFPWISFDHFIHVNHQR